MTSLLLAVALLQSGPVDLTLKVDGVERKATVYRSTIKDKPVPIVFVFHGFTGTGKHAAAAYKVHQTWPEATVVYPQGLEVQLLGTKGPGWQIAPKLQESRDVKFYDAILARMKSEYSADPKRIYTCGMSNGAIFSYVLLAERADTLAAAAPVAGFAPPAFKGAAATPLLIIHGKNDNLLTLTGAERSRDTAIANNRAVALSKEWAPGYIHYGSETGKDVIWHVHEGGHIWPTGATDSIVKFFKMQARL